MVVLDDIVQRNKNVVLNVDIMFVNGVAFLITLGHKIKLITTKYLPARTAKQIA